MTVVWTIFALGFLHLGASVFLGLDPRFDEHGEPKEGMPVRSVVPNKEVSYIFAYLAIMEIFFSALVGVLIGVSKAIF